MAAVSDKEHWTRRACSGLVLLLIIAIGARVVYGLLVPLCHTSGSRHGFL
jgi:hypothetical protein